MLNVISKILVYDFKITQVNDWLSDIGREKPAYIIFVILNNWQNTCYMTKENRLYTASRDFIALFVSLSPNFMSYLLLICS